MVSGEIKSLEKNDTDLSLVKLNHIYSICLLALVFVPNLVWANDGDINLESFNNTPFKLSSVNLSSETAFVEVNDVKVHLKTIFLAVNTEKNQVCEMPVVSVDVGIITLNTSFCEFQEDLKAGAPLVLKPAVVDRSSEFKSSTVGAWYSLNTHSSSVASVDIEGDGFQAGLWLSHEMGKYFRTIVTYGTGKQGEPKAATSDLQTYRVVNMGTVNIMGGVKYKVFDDESIVQPFIGLGLLHDNEEGAVIGGKLKYNAFGIGPALGVRLYYEKWRTAFEISYTISMLGEALNEIRPTSSFNYEKPKLSSMLLTVRYDAFPWNFLSSFFFARMFSINSDSRTGVGSSTPGSFSLSTVNVGLGVAYAWGS